MKLNEQAVASSSRPALGRGQVWKKPGNTKQSSTKTSKKAVLMQDKPMPGFLWEKERRKHSNEKMDKGFIFVRLDKKGVDEVSDTEGHEHFAPDMALYSLAYLSKMMQNIERNMEVQE